MKMNPEVKAAWVAALRSGKYFQGKHSLRTNHDGFCCLGVMCDVIDPNCWVEHPDDGTLVTKWTLGPKDGNGNTDHFVPEKNFPTLKYRQAAGWPADCADPLVEIPLEVGDYLNDERGSSPTKQMSLSSLNDSGNWSFEQIADLIEAQL